MRHVQIINDAFVRHILSDRERIQWDDDNYTCVRRLTTEKREEFGVEKLQLVTPPGFDRVTQVRTEGDAVLVGEVWNQQWIVTNLSGSDLTESKQKMKERVVEIMAEKQDGGITFNGLAVSTDVYAVADLNGDQNSGKPDDIVIVPRKGKGAKATLTRPQRNALFNAVVDYRTEVMEHAGSLIDDIENDIAIDLDSGWPSTIITSP